jgi:hypothetical protein
MVTIRKATYQQVLQAVQNTSKKFGGNVVANRFDQEGGKFFVTLKVQNSHGAGAAISFSGRSLPNACWHAYGAFFDELFAQNPDIVIIALGQKITANEGNWSDFNIGSIAVPLLKSKACECESSDDKSNKEVIKEKFRGFVYG